MSPNLILVGVIRNCQAPSCLSSLVLEEFMSRGLWDLEDVYRSNTMIKEEMEIGCTCEFPDVPLHLNTELLGSEPR